MTRPPLPLPSLLLVAALVSGAGRARAQGADATGDAPPVAPIFGENRAADGAPPPSLPPAPPPADEAEPQGAGEGGEGETEAEGESPTIDAEHYE
ncbi:MAG TPA: hypothetical protein VIF57_27450, partial [Polyangia bacterium]